MIHRLPLLILFTLALISVCSTVKLSAQDRPNIILIMMDDQGYGDFGFTGNPYVQTPNLDYLANHGTFFNSFYVSPVCAPTRSSLLTGRQSVKTGVYDTYNGGAIMHTDEITLAEELKSAGYATGIFGKWHLGDTYPGRPSDQGFQESLIHQAGGMAQVGDPYTYFQERPYFDPVLFRNNDTVKIKGYCSDIFTDAALEFIGENRSRPFFTYLAFNAPHTPLDVPESYYEKHRNSSLDTRIFSERGFPVPAMTDQDKEDARKIYAMIENIDDNIGRLLDFLRSNNLLENTILFFLTDNGPQQRRFNAGYRGLKGTVYEGGIRVPMITFPRMFNHERISLPLTHMDLFPTVLELCGVPLKHKIDGSSFLPVLKDEEDYFSNRPLFHDWTRGYLTPYQNMAVRLGDYKLIGQSDYDAATDEFELFNLKDDPFEQHNLIYEQKFMADSLRVILDEWIRSEVWNSNREPRIVIGNVAEEVTLLNRNDAKGQPGIWAQEQIYGYWDVEFSETGYYDFDYQFIKPVKAPGTIRLNLKPLEYTKSVPKDVDKMKLQQIYIQKGFYRLETWYQPGNGQFILPFTVSVRKG